MSKFSRKQLRRVRKNITRLLHGTENESVFALRVAERVLTEGVIEDALRYGALDLPGQKISDVSDTIRRALVRDQKK